jgi:hypothetical protein
MVSLAIGSRRSASRGTRVKQQRASRPTVGRPVRFTEAAAAESERGLGVLPSGLSTEERSDLRDVDAGVDAFADP